MFTKVRSCRTWYIPTRRRTRSFTEARITSRRYRRWPAVPKTILHQFQNTPLTHVVFAFSTPVEFAFGRNRWILVTFTHITIPPVVGVYNKRISELQWMLMKGQLDTFHVFFYISKSTVIYFSIMSCYTIIHLAHRVTAQSSYSLMYI